MFFRRLLVFLFLLALAILPGKAQSRRSVFSIGGNIRDAGSQRSMENIQVTLKGPTGIPLNSVFTRGNGDFQFDGLPNGEYDLEIRVKDYEQVQERVLISNASRVGISIFLSRSGKAATPAPQLSISAHQLSVPHKAHDEFEKGMGRIYSKSDLRGAIAQFQLAIKDFPTYYEAFAEEGIAYYQLGEFGPAEEALQKSVELSSGQYADAVFALAALLTDTKRYAEAETLSRRGISADASSWRGPFELARALTALKQTDEAEKSAQQSRDLMPDNPSVYLLLANIHIQRRDYPALLRDLDDYLRLAPIGPEADQARKTRERVQSLMNSQKNDSEKNEDDADPHSEKEPPPSVQPDTSGLPSLPPPTPGNQ